MIRFLNELTLTVKRSKGCARDIMTSLTKFGSVKVNDTIETALLEMSKKKNDKIVVVFDTDCFIVDSRSLCVVIGLTGSIKKKMSIMRDYALQVKIIDINTPVSDIPDGITFVTEKNKIKGIIV